MGFMRICTALVLLFALQGCITIEENYTFKSNGSGTMEYVVDMSSFGEMMESMGDMAGEESSELGDLFESDAAVDFLIQTVVPSKVRVHKCVIRINQSIQWLVICDQRMKQHR